MKSIQQLIRWCVQNGNGDRNTMKLLRVKQQAMKAPVLKYYMNNYRTIVKANEMQVTYTEWEPYHVHMQNSERHRDQILHATRM